ncbi:hypothetical protein [Aliihoeflea sp. 40Bstr573]|uniref:hypothetical protein n=1 Tax=Aliihoeflea sp. 40Bstr573 TaxID=2696467 RepID=UPI002094112C|nr:hypothetical protein [Aliihoeflea sp. 40Bstr573]MCO6388642.1 hypothetical protein [Aliihoeflea sp. 40Bstr573]
MPLFDKNPALGLLAMEAIASWSNVENFLLGLYLELLGGAGDRAAIAYLAIETQSAKTQAINAVARSVLSDEHSRLLAAILAVAKTSQKSRDKLAHHVWGFSPDLPAALLLIDPRVAARETEPEEYRKHVMVYRELDFREIIDLNNRICGWGLDLRFILMGHVANGNGAIYDALCAEPEFEKG